MADLWVVILQFIISSNGDDTTDSGITNVAQSYDLKPSLHINLKLDKSITIYILLASVVVSYVLVILDIRKAIKIVESRDIAYAFTSTIAYRYYAIKSYPHYCFFAQIQNSRKRTDIIAFFVFFTLKGWKRLLFAEFPRQLLNFLLLVQLYETYGRSKNAGPFTAISNIQASSHGFTELAAYGLASLTVLVWLISFALILLAFLCYFPLVCVIRGNLKEYVCHKIDKR